jgi:hypothetical protein
MDRTGPCPTRGGLAPGGQRWDMLNFPNLTRLNPSCMERKEPWTVLACDPAGFDINVNRHLSQVKQAHLI